MSYRVGGWQHERENQAAILNRSLWAYAEFRNSLEVYDWDPPKEIDPRNWSDVPDQGQMGSCQGNALAQAGELVYMVHHGRELQFSRLWAYLVSQDFDNISSDSGSTLDGGSKCAQQVGLVLEEDFPYTDNYASARSRYRQQRAALLEKAKDYKMFGEAPLGSYEDMYNWLAAGLGPVQIGIMWGVPDAWEVTSYSPGGGGHSVNFVGYLQVQAWQRPGLLLQNSWGTRWGREGYQLWKSEAVDAATRHRWNVFLGRSDMKSPRPRPRPDL